MPEGVGGFALVLLLALGIELLAGEPRTRWHPVALFGRFVDAVMRIAPASGRVSQLAFGTLVVLASVGGVAGLSAAALSAVTAAHPAFGIVAGAGLLKASFAYRQLEHEAARVATHVGEGQLAAARTALRALVSRETSDLDQARAASAAIESVAENLSDSFVAPLFCFVLFGVPGALAYRAVNTLDAMIGYHGQYEYLGRAAAKLDDLANLVPARLTTGLLVLAAALAGRSPGAALRIALRDHGRTESPNAGWPMAAMAGALSVRLEKIGHYHLGDADRPCDADAIRGAIGIARWTAALTAGATLAVVTTWPQR